uniref:Uncharacterized protein n=1 Tax=Onchocerca volvulus TaxID=6282 RepID=A0A8R1TN44_ONCVO
MNFSALTPIVMANNSNRGMLGIGSYFIVLELILFFHISDAFCMAYCCLGPTAFSDASTNTCISEYSCDDHDGRPS